MLKGKSSSNERYANHDRIPTRCIEEYNQACLHTSEIPRLNKSMRHVDLAEISVKEKVESKEIKLLKLASGDNTSHIGTKRLALSLFNKSTSRIMDTSLIVNS